MDKILLVDWADSKDGRGIWRRLLPRKHCVGVTAGGAEVWLLEVPFTEADERGVLWLKRRLRRLEKSADGEPLHLGLPLGLAEKMESAYPNVLAAGRALACREVARRLERQSGGLLGAEVGVLGLDEEWQAALVRELIARGARVAVSGGYARHLAAGYWREGVALPVLSERKLVESCDCVIVMRGYGRMRLGGKLVFFAEPQVFVEGRFVGKYAFGMFPAGMAAAVM